MQQDLATTATNKGPNTQQTNEACAVAELISSRECSNAGSLEDRRACAGHHEGPALTAPDPATLRARPPPLPLRHRACAAHPDLDAGSGAHAQHRLHRNLSTLQLKAGCAAPLPWRQGWLGCTALTTLQSLKVGQGAELSTRVIHCGRAAKGHAEYTLHAPTLLPLGGGVTLDRYTWALAEPSHQGQGSNGGPSCQGC